MNKLKPLEDMYKFHDFHSPPLDEADFDSKEKFSENYQILRIQYKNHKGNTDDNHNFH